MKKYPLFHSHLELAHSYWQKLLRPGDHAIDATCGNGLDTAFLATCLFSTSDHTGTLLAIDKQAEAIEATKRHLEEKFEEKILKQITLLQQCHSTFPASLPPIKLIVYNLGFLPHGDKALKTQTETTLTSLTNALPLMQPGGAISITCYPGHPGGKEEELALRAFAASLRDGEWSCYLHERLNRRNAPSLLLIQKAIQPLVEIQ